MEKKIKCFQCKKEIIRKYVLSKKDYSQKNNWEYWTESEKDKGEYICNSCLLDLYYKDKGEYLKKVQNEKKEEYLPLMFTTKPFLNFLCINWLMSIEIWKT